MFILDTVRRLATTDRIAAVSAEGVLSYAQLEEYSEALAVFLLERYRSKQPIVLWGDKENLLLVGMLAALKSAKPYVMIPNFYPNERVKQIVKNAQPCCVLSFGKVAWPIEQKDIYDINNIKRFCSDFSKCKVNPTACVQPEDKVCLFYTSGSTGNPKCVAVKRKNIEALVSWWRPISDAGVENPRMLNFVPYSFAYSMGPLYNYMGLLGATLYAVDHAMIGDFSSLMDLILNADPHYLNCTPSFVEICMQDKRFCSQYMPSMSRMVMGGEPLSHRIAQKLLERFPRLYLLNGYGSTETTIGPISCVITREMALDDAPLPVGYAWDNAECKVLDEGGKELPDGEIGELVIISDMVVEGYDHDPERSAAAFFTASDGRMGFHTRDLVRRLNGLFYYVGRVDNMVKIGGYRVEIEELENKLAQLEGVQRCAIAPVAKDGRALYLAAYVVLEPGITGGVAQTIMLKKGLSNHVQAYMVPQKFVYLDALPKNTNGKIDRRKLAEMSCLSPSISFEH